MNRILSLIIIALLFISCAGTKSTLQNVDNTAIKPMIKNDCFIITEYSQDSKYGYDKDYPINIGFNRENEAPKNIGYFFNALEGQNGELFTFEKIDTCCPFPTKRTAIGVGTLDIYEITFLISKKKIQLYFNIYDKGKIMCPKGFLIKKF